MFSAWIKEAYKGARMSFPRVDGLRTVEFGNPGESRSKILDCLFNGNKRATAGLVEYDYVAENEPFEHVGEVLVVVGNDGEDLGRIRVTSVEVVRFDQVLLVRFLGGCKGKDCLRESRTFQKSI
jgi:uncharacterized protein YhfF